MDDAAALNDPNLAAKLLGADLAVLGGTYLPGGIKLINSDTGAWDTQLILIDLLAADNDTVNGGAGDDILFGQRGDDTINGNDGADLIFADGATNVVPFLTNMPQIISGVRLLSAGPGVPINLVAGGEVIVPNMTIQPQELNTLPPQINFVPDLGFADLASNDTLKRNDGAVMVPLISFVPDIVHHADALPGNDVIDGGAGGDTIFGDDAVVNAPVFSGLAAINTATEDVRRSIFLALGGLHQLSLDYGVLEHTAFERRHARHPVGNDTIAGGDDADRSWRPGADRVPFMLGSRSKRMTSLRARCATTTSCATSNTSRPTSSM